MNESEMRFDKFLRDLNIRHEYIDINDKHNNVSKPDFKIYLPNWDPIWVEVKELLPNGNNHLKRPYPKAKIERVVDRTLESNLRRNLLDQLPKINKKFKGRIGKKVLVVYSDRGLREKTPIRIKYTSEAHDNKVHLGVPPIDELIPTIDHNTFEKEFDDSELDLIVILDRLNNILDPVYIRGKSDNEFMTFFEMLFHVSDYENFKNKMFYHIRI